MFRLSENFILKYIEQYNKGNVITEVNVEYEDVGGEEWMGDDHTGEPFWNEILQLKLDKDGCIITHKIQDSFTREEVKELLQKFWEITTESTVFIPPISWFNKNY